MTLPPSPPARIEIAGLLLDRRLSLPVSLVALGEEAPAVQAEGVISLYLGSVGDAALVLESGETHVWHGQRLEPGDWDNLGRVD